MCWGRARPWGCLVPLPDHHLSAQGPQALTLDAQPASWWRQAGRLDGKSEQKQKQTPKSGVSAVQVCVCVSV